jgi:hypothetical protein
MSWIQPYYQDVSQDMKTLSDGAVYKFGEVWEILLNGSWRVIRPESALAEALNVAMYSRDFKAIREIEIFTPDILCKRPYISFRKVEVIKHNYSAIPSYGIF